MSDLDGVSIVAVAYFVVTAVLLLVATVLLYLRHPYWALLPGLPGAYLVYVVAHGYRWGGRDDIQT